MFAKKSVVAGAALLAMAAAAQADVKIYGYLDAAFGSYENFVENAAGTAITTERTTRVSSGNMMTSFIGFAGSEDLGGGLKAEFALESFLGVDTGTVNPTYSNLAGGFWGRASWVGLSGGFGRVILGQYDNAFFTLGYTYNPFGSSMTFSPTMVSWYGLSGDVTGAALGYDTGWVNSITYETPNLGGFTASLQFAPKESTGANDGDKNNYALSAAYNAGPLSLMAVYTNSGDASTNTAYFIRQKNFGLGASYDFGVVKLQGQYAQIKSFDSTTGDESEKDKFFQLGATIPVTSAGNVLVTYGQTKYEIAAGQAKLKQFAVGYDHSISKRTGAYVAFTNKKLSGDIAIDDDTANVFAVGIRHSF
ncbi:MAG TPA: porin [Candidatus Aquabacterium excrementipullorum]|nr:porin [Candidatus Aquabacterium excrementipullorum]